MFEDYKGQSNPTYKEYITICEELGEEPDPAKAPVRLIDLSEISQIAWHYYVECRNHTIVNNITGQAGLSFVEIKTLMDIKGMPQHRRNSVFERIMFIYYWVEQRSLEPEEANGN